MLPEDSGLKSSREHCYNSRDIYFSCLDSNNGDQNKCKKELREFEKACPASWHLQSNLLLIRRINFRQSCALLFRAYSSPGHPDRFKSRVKIINNSVNKYPKAFYALQYLTKNGDRELTTTECQNLPIGDDFPISFYFEYFGRQELPLAYLSFLRYFLKDNKRSRMLVLPAAKTLSIMYSKRLVKKQDVEEFIPLIKKMADEVPVEKMRNALNLYLRILSDENVFSSKNDEQVPVAGYVAITISAIEKRDVEELKKVYDRFPMHSIHNHDWIHKAFKEFFLEENAPKAELLQLYMDRVAKFDSPLKFDIFETYVEPILRNSPNSQLNHLKMDPLERKCPSCGELWPPMKKLTSEEHGELLATFEKKFINLFENFQHGSTKELLFLRNLVDTLKMKPEFSGPKLVIDSLNMSRGNLATDIPIMFNAVLELQKSYPGILIVSRASSISRNNPIYRGQVERLKRANVGVFHAHRQSYDDLFTILGALWLGEDTHVLSNDMYSDVCDYIRNSSAEQLFMKWLNSSMVRRNGVFEKGDFVLLPVPSFDRVVQKTSNGYHITTLKDLDDSIAGRPTTFSKIYEHYCFITDANHNTACQETSKQMSHPEKTEAPSSISCANGEITEVRNHLWSFTSINENHLKKPSIEE